MNFSVIGLGKLGACMAAAFADRGHEVIGVDCDPTVVEAVNGGRSPVVEPGLPELIARNGGQLWATTSYAEAVERSDVTFVVVPTPSDEVGAFSAEYAKTAFAEVGRGLRAKDGYHLIVLTSTVLPGVTRHLLQPIVELESGRRCGPDFGLCYSPEFIALGSVIHDLLNPEFVLIGEHDERAGSVLEGCYGQIVSNGAPCRRMSLENAELAKVALNAFVTTKIAFANTVADLCERIPGGDVDAVTDAIGLDTRIGRRYLRGGLGFGGPCFPRDNAAFTFLARALGSRADISEATDARNRRRIDELVAVVEPLLDAGASRVAVLGLSYKPGSAVVEGSQGLELARRLRQQGATVLGFDPLVAEISWKLDGEIPLARSLEECIANVDIVVLANPDPAFAGLAALLPRGESAPAMIDCWRAVPDYAVVNPTRYHAVGQGRPDGEIASCFAALWSEASEPVSG